jgi:RHH-type rel operon transcriptional repressor/antitoxin RelB
MMMEVEAMAKILNMRVSDEVARRLDTLSAKTKRPKSFYLKEMLDEYLAEFEDEYLALDRLNEKNAKYYKTKEVEDLLDL